MIFNSYNFLFILLPAALLTYVLFIKLFGRKAAHLNILISSLVFYGSSSLNYLFIFLFSILVNFLIGKSFEFKNFSYKERIKKSLLVLGIFFNLSVLFIFKYYDFFVDNLSFFLINLPKLNFLLPIGISFYTFQQIGFLLDIYEENNKKYDLLDYALFVTFFPQLIAGPIVRFSDFIEQLNTKKENFLNKNYYSTGLVIFVFGLCKKIIIADFLFRNFRFFYDAIPYGYVPTIFSAWINTIAYSLQIYFDFSAYSDMAIGLGLFFGIRLPVNFDSPYKSKSLVEFWNRWNITLSHFFRDRLYTPIFINLSNKSSLSLNNHLYAILLTMPLLGLWHGASWNWILFGLMQGVGLVINNIFKAKKIFPNMPICLRRVLLLVFINISFVFARAKDFFIAKQVIYSLFPLDKLNRISMWNLLNDELCPNLLSIFCLVFLLAVVLFLPSNLSITGYLDYQNNSSEIISPFKKLNLSKELVIICSTFLSVIFLICLQYLHNEQEFIYFQF